MDTRLTHEFASSAELSRNPFKRHYEVKAVLRNPEFVGEGVRLALNNELLIEPTTTVTGEVRVHTFLPIVGRSALHKTATALEIVELR